MAVGRFQVMAILQAARAYILGMKITEAKSFGLNRAIFYAAAKRGFKVKARVRPRIKSHLRSKGFSAKELKGIEKTYTMVNIGDEGAYCIEIKGRRLFVMGNEVQTPEDFKRQIEQRFGKNFKDAWKEALEICRQYDKAVLLSQRYFYETIYRPRRDELAKKWSEK